jgi:anti-anti-sigma factor
MGEMADDVLTDIDGATATVRVAGDFDAARTKDVREAILAAEVGSQTLVLDLSNVTFIDSSGLGVIAAAAARAERDGKSFGLCDPAPAVEHTLMMFGLDSMIVRSLAGN